MSRHSETEGWLARVLKIGSFSDKEKIQNSFQKLARLLHQEEIYRKGMCRLSLFPGDAPTLHLEFVVSVYDFTTLHYKSSIFVSELRKVTKFIDAMEIKSKKVVL